eukprot:GHRR01027864.1.p1 GENE.GHRR01027864.1~~GHRR01027864.1.p1  ORF type:complete len:109 (+),score=6.68 GHRR01027864.1:251-577(+)
MPLLQYKNLYQTCMVYSALLFICAGSNRGMLSWRAGQHLCHSCASGEGGAAQGGPAHMLWRLSGMIRRESHCLQAQPSCMLCSTHGTPVYRDARLAALILEAQLACPP